MLASVLQAASVPIGCSVAAELDLGNHQTTTGDLGSPVVVSLVCHCFAQRDPMFDSFPRPLIFGHRGACAQAPENTLESFQLAVDAGVDVLELDVP